ncbi:uncharacterized protein zgc:113276 isoform X1 [Acipenser ruthenus]|uniref:uncharacterized protein zgc:113276 isoform X1 n=1 Tax=Acipenser ruthenus TaxID=7906 RepID=UPI0027408669|nr:uncharacterized protein zgc:113276 isoform X1 [Acipenser ruthenus]XP_058884916.1 uncharacterized protein zgc:113276 isoform X1 [Acipenser ruthenus]XP_058884917.1 uncharacterized protein zgc:113276 isoform X1 [Acipenser ruthenus]
MLDVLIVGGGPHALTLATLLKNPCFQTGSPHSEVLDGIVLSKKKSKNGRAKTAGKNRAKQTQAGQEDEPMAHKDMPSCPPLSIKVVDLYGEWMTLWEKQFAALNIPHLRSHTLVHTDPLNKKALQEFVIEHERMGELHCLPEHIYIQDENAFFNDNRLGKKDKKKLSANSSLRKSLYFSLPGTKLSMDFFMEQVQKYHLESILVRGTVDRIIPVLEPATDVLQNQCDHKRALYFKVVLQSGEAIESKQVVMATGPTRTQMANIPSWVTAISESYPEERLQHTVQLMHLHNVHQQNQPHVCQKGDRLMVVGGGLTSAHIISFALQQGASQVTWVMRKHLQLKQFDVGDIETLVGRYSHVEHGIKLDGLAYLRQFYNERSLHKRLIMIRQARKGGAVTPEAYQQLQPFISSGNLIVKTYCQVSEAKWSYKDQEWAISLSTSERWSGDRIWLATGCKLDVTQDSLLSDVIKEFPIQILDGWPSISENLQWAPGCDLYLMGQYSALQIGPHAVNLAGGQAASARIAKAIHYKHREPCEKCTALDTTQAEQTQKEAYIQQMHGLMWL